MTQLPPTRRVTLARLIALLGLLSMVVIGFFGLAAQTYESGDRSLYLAYAGVIVGVVTTIASVFWVDRSVRKGAAIPVLVVSILMNPIWMLLLIRLFG